MSVCVPLKETSESLRSSRSTAAGRSMPPTEINGASRRILALSFVLALCKVSRTHAPLVADSLLNFMSGSVRTNTLRVTAETANQPILLLTGSDLESQNEVDLVARYADATYTLTGQWQHMDHGGDVVNQTDARQVSLVCKCGPREYCNVCERHGQAGSPGWTSPRNWRGLGSERFRRPPLGSGPRPRAAEKRRGPNQPIRRHALGGTRGASNSGPLAGRWTSGR